MTLSAGTLLANLGHEKEAYDLYKNVLEAFPGYPGKKDLYERLAKVALELKKTDEAKEYSRLAKES
jgi:tetratricopeptide (TPR) repeat protein